MKIQSIDRALQILGLFSHSHPRWGITELAQQMDLTKGTVHNIVKTMEQNGFLEKDRETLKYLLGPKLLTLGTIMAQTLEINQRAYGPVNQLTRRTNLSCRIAIWDRDAALITLEVRPLSRETIARRIGPRVPAYCTSMGRALLAHLEPDKLDFYLDNVEIRPLTPKTVIDRDALIREIEKTRERGYAVNDEEFMLGVAGLAATIFSHGGRLAASIHINGRPERILGEGMPDLIRSLRDTTAEISQYMGFFTHGVETRK